MVFYRSKDEEQRARIEHLIERTRTSERQQIARRMLAANMSFDLICKALDLNAEEELQTLLNTSCSDGFPW